MEGLVSGLEAYSEWQERLKRFESSGLSIDVFCQQEDVGQSTFLDWLRVLPGGGLVRLSAGVDRAVLLDIIRIISALPQESPS